MHHTPESRADGTWRTGVWWYDDRRNVWEVFVEWRPERGRLEPAGVTVTSRTAKVTAEAIRRLPLGTMFVDMQRHAERMFAEVATARVIGPNKHTIDSSPDAEWRTAYADVAKQFGTQRGRRLSHDQLETVAEVYREAYRDRKPVTKAVADATGCSLSTAGKRIMAARKAGLLQGTGPTS
jgi:hypothetical protein